MGVTMAKLSDKARQKKSKYNTEYNAKNTRRFVMNANKNTDQDIIEKLESVENKQKYIFDLIRKDIIANKK